MIYHHLFKLVKSKVPLPEAVASVNINIFNKSSWTDMYEESGKRVHRAEYGR